MKIAFFYEFGQIKEIGMGHKYRSKNLAIELRRRGHTTWMFEDNSDYNDADVVVIDHLFTQKDLIQQIRAKNKKIVLIDGAKEDVSLVDLSISAIYNEKAEYRGVQYIALPQTMEWTKYRPYNKSKSIFVGMGGFDNGNYAEIAIRAAKNLNLDVIIAKSINHQDYSTIYPGVIMFEGEDYYTAMKECMIGVMNGGLTLFQGLHYGLPCVAIPQYDHQKDNILTVQHCCSIAEPNEEDVSLKMQWFLNSESFRESISKLAQYCIDGKGIQRICTLIENLK